MYKLPKVHIFIFYIIIFNLQCFGQRTITKQENGNVKGVLSFLSFTELSEGLMAIYPNSQDRADPKIDRTKWQFNNKKSIAIRNFVKDAVMYFEWWTLLQEPVERYQFKWLTTGSYEVQYQDNGESVIKHVSRENLLKYPDLLKRFDNIEPLNVDLEIRFSSDNIDEQKYHNFRRNNNITTDLGSAGYTNTYTIQVLGVHYLFAPSGKKPPFIVPNIAAGGWVDWLNLTNNDLDMIKRHVEIFKLGREINIKDFKITNLEWPYETFVEISKRYDNYELKKESPKEIVERTKIENNSNNNNDDFWNHGDELLSEMEIYIDPTNRKYGLKEKKGLRAIPATFDRLITTSNKNVFLGSTSQGLFAVNKDGKVLASISNEWYLVSDGSDGYVMKNMKAPEVNDCPFKLMYKQKRYFENGGFSKVTNTAIIEYKYKYALEVRGRDYKEPTEESKRKHAIYIENCEKSLKAIAISDGYSVE